MRSLERSRLEATLSPGLVEAIEQFIAEAVQKELAGVPREVSELLKVPEAVLTRTDLAQLGYGRRAIDAIFKQCMKSGGVEVWEDHKRPMIRVKDFLRVREERTFRDDRVWPT